MAFLPVGVDRRVDRTTLSVLRAGEELEGVEEDVRCDDDEDYLNGNESVSVMILGNIQRGN